MKQKGVSGYIRSVFRRKNKKPTGVSGYIQALSDSDMRNIKRTSLNRICDISDWKIGDRISEIMKSLNEGVYIHRKSWEYALCIHGLEKLGVVKPFSKALAVGAGYERPLYYFANRIAKMVATDLYNDEAHEGKPSMLLNPRLYAPFDYREDHLFVQRMDGTNLEFGDNVFDFAFSLSSIEHFGNKKNSKKAVQEMQRVLLPGGIMCIATEILLNESKHYEYFTLEEINHYILGNSGLKLVGGDIDLRISKYLVENPVRLDVESELNISPHIVLSDGKVVWTSIIMFLQKDPQV